MHSTITNIFAYIVMISSLPGDQNLQAEKVIQVKSAMGASPGEGHAADLGLTRDGRIQDAANQLLTYLVNMLRSDTRYKSSADPLELTDR